MANNRFQSERSSQYSRGEYQRLNETSYLDFAVSRFESIPDSLFDEFAQYQSSTADNPSTSLLEFKGIDVSSITGLSNIHKQEGIHGYEGFQREEELEPICDPTAVYEEKLRTIQQRMKLINSLTTKIEQNLHLNTPITSSQTEDELEIFRLQELQNDEDLYRDLYFGGNYQFDPKSQSRNRGANRRGFNKSLRKSQNTKLFSIPEHDDFFLQAIKLTSFHSLDVSPHDNRNIKDKQNKEKKKLSISFPNFTKLDDFFKFDDILQSIFIDHSKNFEDIRIIINYENNLAILCLLKFLLLIKSCNLFTLEFNSHLGSYQADSNQDQSFGIVNKVKNILERIFFVTLSIRNLQSLSIEMNSTLFPYFCSGINRITDPSKLNLQYFFLNGFLQNANTNNMAECIDFFSRIPTLFAFQSETIVINGKKSEDKFHKLLKNIHSIQLKLQEIPRDFSFELPLDNLIKFDFSLTFEPMQLNEKLLDSLLSSIKSAKNLGIFNLRISTFFNYHTSRRNILCGAQKRKELEEQKTKEILNEEDSTNLLLFGHLIDLPQLKSFNVICGISEGVYDSLFKLLEKNTNILEMKILLQNPDCLCLNYRNILEILNNRKNLKYFSLNVKKSIFILYKILSKMSKSYYFQCEDVGEFDCITKSPTQFNPAHFQFDKVSKIKLKFHFSQLQEFENLCESIENTPNLVSIVAKVEPRQVLIDQLQKNPRSQPNFRFLERLEKLKYLKHLSINTVVNQQVLDSFESFIRRSTSLRSFLFERYPCNQYYLNYTGLFRGISASKSIEQLYFNAQIESIAMPSQENIRKWEEVKIVNLYQPLADVYRNGSSQLIFIEINDKKDNEAGLIYLLEQILASPNQIYTMFSNQLWNKFKNTFNERAIALLNEASLAGHLVHPDYQFPFSFTTISDYW